VGAAIICKWEGKAELVPVPDNKQDSLYDYDISWDTLGHQSLKGGVAFKNDLLLKTAKQLVKRMGHTVVSSYVKVDDNKELSYLTVR